MGTLLWLNIPLMLLFFCCWAGIPLWLTFTRWNAEISAKHAALAAKAGTARVFIEAVPIGTGETESPVRAVAVAR